MTINEYQQAALRTGGSCNIINCALGMCGESGEVADKVKKHLFQGHELDAEQLVRELGDVAWYVAVAAHVMGYTLEDVLQINVDKLKARYPDGFETERSLHRQEGDT